MQFEEALQLTGEFGVFQWLLIAYLALFMVPMHAISMAVHVFTLLVPPHWCRQQELEAALNLTRAEARELGVPREQDGSWSMCTMYDINVTALTTGRPLNESSRGLLPVVPCRTGWHYDHSVIYPTIVSELDWVCGQSWKAYVSHTVFFGSMAIGVVFFGAISDKVGRVPVMVAVYMLAGVGAATSYFCKDIYVFLATRVIEGGVMLSICTIPFVLALEYMPAKKRMLMAGVFGFAYPLLGATIPWVAYALAHWRLLNAIILLPCLGGTVVTLFIPESTRWLLSKGKTDKAKKVLLCVARINGKHLKVSAIDSLQPPRQGDSVPSSTAAIFKYPSLRRSFVITLFLRMIACLANQAGQLYVATATDDPFVLSSTTNAVDIVGIWVAVPLADKCGRRATVACSCALAGLCYLIAAGLNGMPVALLAALMAGRTMLTIAYDVGSVYAAEIYPTEIRTQALSTRQAIGSVGRILSSHVVQLAVYSRSLPLFVVGGLSCVSALITLPLPETNNQRLPESFQEAEAMHELPVVPLFPCCVRAKVRRGDVLAVSAAATIQADVPHDTERKEHLLSHPAAEHGGAGHAMSGISKL